MDKNTETSAETNVGTNDEIQPKPKRPAVVTIAAILLIILSLFVAMLGIANPSGFLGRGFRNRSFTPGQFGNGNFSPPNGFRFNGQNNGGGAPNFNPNGQNNGGTPPNFTGNRPGFTGLARIFRILRPVTIAFDIILLVLSVVAAIGLFKSKRWAAILAFVLAVLVILLALPGMLRIFAPLILVENLLRILAAIAVIVLLLLPSARRAFATSPASGEEELERFVR